MRKFQSVLFIALCLNITACENRKDQIAQSGKLLKKFNCVVYITKENWESTWWKYEFDSLADTETYVNNLLKLYKDKKYSLNEPLNLVIEKKFEDYKKSCQKLGGRMKYVKTS